MSLFSKMAWMLEPETKELLCQKLRLLRDYSRWQKADVEKVYDTALDLITENYKDFEQKIQNNTLSAKQLEDLLTVCDYYHLYEGTIIIIKRLNELNALLEQCRFELSDIE